MGGPGSGRLFRFNKKATTESQKYIDIRWMKKQNILIPGNVGTFYWSRNDEKNGSVGFEVNEDSLNLKYRYRERGKDWKNLEQIIYFDQTDCNYGGYRKWFLCPQCKKRVGVLYGSGKLFFCRQCNNLTYNCCNTHPRKRIYNKANKLRKKLDGKPGAIHPIPDRPKGMHWSTYFKLKDEIRELEYLGDLALFEKWEPANNQH